MLNLIKIFQKYDISSVYSPTFGEVIVDYIDNTNYFQVITDYIEQRKFTYHPNGVLCDVEGIPNIFPNKDLYIKYPLSSDKAWEEYIKSLRWRAGIGENYFYIDSTGKIRMSYEHSETDPDNQYIDQCRFDIRNYFKYESDAKQVLPKFLESFDI